MEGLTDVDVKLKLSPIGRVFDVGIGGVDEITIIVVVVVVLLLHLLIIDIINKLITPLSEKIHFTDDLPFIIIITDNNIIIRL